MIIRPDERNSTGRFYYAQIFSWRRVKLEIIGNYAHKGIVFDCIMGEAFFAELLRELFILVVKAGGDLVPLGLI